MKKANLLATSLLSLGLLGIYSCQDLEVERASPLTEQSLNARLVKSYGLKQLSEQETQRLLNSKDVKSFKNIEEAEEYMLSFKEMGYKGIHFTSKVELSTRRTAAGENFSVNMYSDSSSNRGAGSSVSLKSLTAKAFGDPEGSTSFSKDFGFYAQAMVSLVWGSSYNNPTAGVSVSSPGNTTTWTTTQSHASYNPSDGHITYTIYGQMTNNFTIAGVGYSQSYNGVISGEYHPLSGQSAINIDY